MNGIRSEYVVQSIGGSRLDFFNIFQPSKTSLKDPLIPSTREVNPRVSKKRNDPKVTQKDRDGPLLSGRTS